MDGRPRLFANLTVSDLDAAVDFYAGTLGFELLGRRELMPGEHEALFDTGAGVVCAAVGTPKPGVNAPFGFEVDDVDAEAARLRAGGVVFEEYDYPQLKTVEGIAEIGGLRVGWFRDPDGTLLGIMSRAPS